MEQVPTKIVPAQETFGLSETPKEKRDRIEAVAMRGIRHAFWDFESRGGTDMDDFLMRSEEFQGMTSNYLQLNKNDLDLARVALNEAKQLLRQKYSSPSKPSTLIHEQINPAQDISIKQELKNEVSSEVERLEVVKDLTSRVSERIESTAISKNFSTTATNEDIFDTASLVEQELPEPLQQKIVIEHQVIAEPIETLINNDIPLKERAETKAPIDKPLYSNDVQSMQEESAPQVVPEMPHNTIENKEVETLYIEAVEDFSSAYKKFFEEISVFNQNTLDMQGVETTGSILSQAEITNIIKKLGNEVSTTPNQTLSVINDVQNYLMENAFPITNGALITAKDGYDHVLNATEQLYISLGVFYQKLQKIGKEKEVGMLIKQLDNDIQTLDEVLNKKKQHVNDYFSR